VKTGYDHPVSWREKNSLSHVCTYQLLFNVFTRILPLKTVTPCSFSPLNRFPLGKELRPSKSGIEMDGMRRSVYLDIHLVRAAPLIGIKFLGWTASLPISFDTAVRHNSYSLPSSTVHAL
jgi:hypothetical protein